MVVLTTFPPPTEGVRLEQPNTAAHMNSTNLGKGTLFIAESRVSWVGSSGNGFSLEYNHISLHAVSRDLNAYPQECLFLMLDAAVEGNGEAEGDDDGTTELRFVPEDKGTLDAMYHAMNICQSLHPDPEDSFSDEDFFEAAEEAMDEAQQMASLSIEQNGNGLDHGDGHDNEMDAGCYEDADDSPEL